MKKKKLTLALGASFAASASLMGATSSERYVYDASGNIVEKQIGDQVTELSYSGNLLKGSWLDKSERNYQYDDAGRLVVELGNGRVVRELDYEFADKVTKVRNGAKTTELFYNAEGQLVGTNSVGNIKTFVWDGLAIVKQGSQCYANEDTGKIENPVLSNSEVTVSDFIGTTLSIGVCNFKSTAFGEDMQEGMFTGKPYVPALERFVFKYRSYSPVEARWTTPDPLGFPDGLNGFTYVKNNPLILLDLEGLKTEHFAVAQDVLSVVFGNHGNGGAYGVTVALESEFDENTGVTIDRVFPFSPSGVTVSGPSAKLNPNDDPTPTDPKDCPHTHGNFFQHRRYNNVKVQASATVVIDQEQTPVVNFQATLSQTGISHAEN